MKPVTITFCPNYLTWRLSFLFLLSLLGLTSCTDECETTITYTVQDPIQMRRAEMAQAVQAEPARPLSGTGKIYTKDHYVFVNELYKGIHVIDNSNLAAPQNIAFLNIPGNVDMAIRDNILFADAGPDLLALDITNPAAVVLKNHTYNIFPGFSTNNTANPSLSDVITVGYNTRIVTEKQSCNTPSITDVFSERADGISFNTNAGLSSASKSAGGTGVGGSMARFTIYGQYLYAINPSAMRVFNIADPAAPQAGALVQMWGGIETVFPYDRKLFIGSMSGMLIYDIQEGATPTFLGAYSHITRCDPVVVAGDYAYVTLRSNPNGMCGRGNSNQLDVIDISNPSQPLLRKTFPMQSPYGLGIDNSTLFLCEGDYGLKVFDAKNPLTVGENQLAHFKNMNMYDVIPLGNTLLAVGSDGLYQYDYSNPKNITFLSKIPVSRP